MNTLMILAVKGAFLGSGTGARAAPFLGAGPLDGFAIGALVSAALCLMITTPRRGRRRAARTARGAGWRPAARRRRRAGRSGSAITLPPAPGPQVTAVSTAGPQEPGGAGPVADSLPDDSAAAKNPDDCPAGRHRLSDAGQAQPRQEPRRAGPRHAAPPASFCSTPSGLCAIRAPGGVAPC